MRIAQVLAASLGAAVALIFGGCEAFIPVPPPPPVVKPPFSYEPLNVRNSCLVESIHFYDVYKAKFGDSGWARVLQWGNRDGDFKVSSGHAVAVYLADGKLFGYDVNFGHWMLDVPPDKRADITEVAPKVVSRYPQFRAAFERYREDWVFRKPPKAPAFLFYHANADVRDATRVASELGKFREVSVVEFNYLDGRSQVTGAAAVFVFNSRLCVYFPGGGTHISNPLVREVKDLNLIGYIVKRFYPSMKDLHVQPGGYLLFPPKS
ncbi:MAG: hypothetical protein QM790_11420 [Nibricoccus sp.]